MSKRFPERLLKTYDNKKDEEVYETNKKKPKPRIICQSIPLGNRIELCWKIKQLDVFYDIRFYKSSDNFTI